jgi:hypothetical protein
MADSFDKRITPARSDLAAAHLKGAVDAAQFVEGEKWSIRWGRVSLRAGRGDNTEQLSELLFGEEFTVYEHEAHGEEAVYAWGQASNDRYVGFLNKAVLGPVMQANKRVIATMTPVFSKPDIKSWTTDFLPLNAVLEQDDMSGDFAHIRQKGFVHYRHLAPVDEFATDFVAVAERFLGAPYVWGGKTAAGLDCSGLIQTALQAIGMAAPRDTDMMEKALGEAVALAGVQRGDLVFWKGHMGVMLDEARLLHANAFHMAVAIEPLAEAMARIEKIAGPVTSAKRL